MAKRIDYNTYIKNCRLKNKKRLNRSFTMLYNHPEELGVLKMPGAINKLILEVKLDISGVDEFIALMKAHGFRVMGGDYYYLECKYNAYLDNPKLKATISDSELTKIEYELLDKKTTAGEYAIDGDDAKLYLLPYNDDIKTLANFIRSYKDEIISFAKEKDLTIVMNPKGYSDQITGFFGFNFYDLDEAEDGNREVEVDYASGINVAVDFLRPITIYSSAMYLSALGDCEDDLSYLKVSLFADNYK